MNFYVVTEGKEHLVYQDWITYVNPRMSIINNIDMVGNNNCYIVSGKGYPCYFDIIESAIQDVNSIDAFTRLVITADSEDNTKEYKYNEIHDFISQYRCRVEIRIVIQHFCIETWGLGNKKINNPNTQSERLRKYRSVFDVRENDPELLPALPSDDLNRSQFAERYLRAVINDRGRNLTYTKSNPTYLAHRSYFDKLKLRLNTTGHISSFKDFLAAFV